MPEKYVNINDRAEFVEALAFLITKCQARHSRKCLANSCLECIDGFFGTMCSHLLPAVDVVPVRHGHWIEQCEESLYRCSACGTEWITIEGTPKENGMDFCPHCGAKMDGKEREENEV